MSWNEQGDEFNPFAPPPAKPSQSQEKQTIQAETLNDFHPFDKSEPAILPTNSTEQKKEETNNFQTITNAELERRQRELEERAAELTRREEAQRRVTSEMKGTLKNFPPLPGWFPLKPCFYQDIDVEIPIEYRRLVRMGHYIWISYCAVLFVNIFGTMSYMISQKNVNESGPLFGMSLLWFFLFVPAAYICWFRSLYKAFRSDSSINFFMFFFIFFAQLIVLFIQVLGINVLGSCGWINSLIEFNTSVGVGVFMLLISVCFTAILVAGAFLLHRVHRVYRSTGASFEKAKAEFGRDLTTNSAVQTAATGLGGAAVSGAMRGPNSGRF